MIQRSIKRLSMRALVVDDELGTATAEGRAVRALVQELQGRAIEVVEATSAEDGTSVITSDSAIHAVLIDWTLGDDKDHERARAFIEFVRSRNDKIPIFLMAERGEASAIPVEVMEMVDEFIWTLEDTAAFVGGRVAAADPPLSRGHAAAAGRGADEVHAGVRVLVAHAGPHGRHRVPQVAGRPDLLRLLRREPAALRPLDQRRQPRLAARPHRARWASTRSTRRACSARIAPTASPTARRCRTA